MSKGFESEWWRRQQEQYHKAMTALMGCRFTDVQIHELSKALELTRMPHVVRGKIVKKGAPE